MICPNCGADMGHSERCPYCGTENESVAQRRHEKEISGIYAKIATLLHIPDAQAQAMCKKIRIAAIVIACAAVMATLGAFIRSKVVPEMGYRAQGAALEQLEALCDAGDFDAMNAILEDRDDSYKAIYGKYTILGGLHENLAWVEENLPEDLELVTEYPEGFDILNYDLNRLFYVLAECQRLEDAGWVYEEEDAAAALRERAMLLLEHDLGLSEDEIARGLAIAGQEDPDYSELSRLIAGRLEDAS